jgi:hypothetical protein
MIAAINDYANQSILIKIRNINSKGERTLGIITKSNRLIPGFKMEKIYFKL